MHWCSAQIAPITQRIWVISLCAHQWWQLLWRPLKYSNDSDMRALIPYSYIRHEHGIRARINMQHNRLFRFRRLKWFKFYDNFIKIWLNLVPLLSTSGILTQQLLPMNMLFLVFSIMQVFFMSVAHNVACIYRSQCNAGWFQNNLITWFV